MADAEPYAQVCAYPECDCSLDNLQPVIAGSSVYCCEGCRDGTGCRHDGCRCVADNAADNRG